MAKILHRGNTNDEFMRGEGTFQIMQTIADLRSQLRVIEVAGRICYRSDKGITNLDQCAKFIRMLIKRGHESVIEHSSLTVIFSDVSRGFTHELVRQRLASFSQESTRYVDYDGGKMDLDKAELTFIYPPHQKLPKTSTLGAIENGLSITKQLQLFGPDEIEHVYQSLRKDGWPPEDARQFLPIGIASKIMVTANFRQWRHIMKMRTQKKAHWEIRYMMCDLLTTLKKLLPVIFEDFHYEYPEHRVSGDPNIPLTDKNGYAYYIQGE
ncbi:hypothetical protein LCGC14_0504130 [marine sediment metagenome]|uniref:Thymidylate synthase (FAD) n=1 Tax=marine sediment metagenome TaxID=412755 RepID=A0A0F9VBM7_9ZZZZ